VANLRFGNVYGPAQNPANGTLIASFVESIFTGNRPQIFGDGSQMRDYIYVEDVAAGIITAMMPEQKLSETMNVCTGISYSVAKVYAATLVAAAMCQFDLEKPEYLDAKPGDKGVVRMQQSDTLLATGWEARKSFVTGICEQIRWRENMKGTWKDDHFMDGAIV
jgi:UDP-glucose 4-epimerase